MTSFYGGHKGPWLEYLEAKAYSGNEERYRKALEDVKFEVERYMGHGIRVDGMLILAIISEALDG